MHLFNPSVIKLAWFLALGFWGIYGLLTLKQYRFTGTAIIGLFLAGTVIVGGYASSLPTPPVPDQLPDAPVPEVIVEKTKPLKKWSKVELKKIAADAALRHGVESTVFLRQIKQESGYNPYAVSYVNGRPCAMGIAQFIPETAASFGIHNKKNLCNKMGLKKCSIDPLKTKQGLAWAKANNYGPFNPERALNASAKLMSSLLKEYNYDYPKALAAYNAGGGYVERGNINRWREPRNYHKTIMDGAKKAMSAIIGKDA